MARVFGRLTVIFVPLLAFVAEGASDLKSSQEFLKRGDNSSGTNIETGYTYSFTTDCYGDGSGGPYQCPSGQWCQVSARDNWYPWDASFMNRGRCLPYATKGAACEPAFGGHTAFPRKADGSFFSRPTLCGPPEKLVCTGDVVHDLPPTCTMRRWPEQGCKSSRPFCAGRPADGGCAPEGRDFCVCPGSSETNFKESSCTADSRLTRTKLEQCGSVFNSFNGPNTAFSRGVGSALPNDNNIEFGQKVVVKKLPLQHGPNSDMANKILQRLWPYPVCDDAKGINQNCTKFPLPVTERDVDGGLTGKLVHKDGTAELAEFLDAGKISGGGVIDYHCSWAILHALSFNGHAMLTTEEQVAFGEMVMYVSGQFDCKVCRNNFVNIVNEFGLPKGPERATYAEWLWRAHNNANEHSYATHSPSISQIASNPNLTENDRRWDMWGNPVHMHPYFMELVDAERVWKLPTCDSYTCPHGSSVNDGSTICQMAECDAWTCCTATSTAPAPAPARKYDAKDIGLPRDATLSKKQDDEAPARALPLLGVAALLTSVTFVVVTLVVRFRRHQHFSTGFEPMCQTEEVDNELS